MKNKTIGIAYVGQTSEQLEAQIEYLHQFGTPLIVTENQPDFSDLDLLYIWDNEHAPALHTKGKATVNQKLIRFLDRIEKIGAKCKLFYCGSVFAHIWGREYGTKHVKNVTGHSDTYHGQFFMGDAVAHLPALKEAAGVKEISFFSSRSDHHQYVDFEIGKEEFDVISYSTSVNRKKFGDMKRDQVKKHKGGVEVILNKNRRVALSFSSPHLMDNALDSYYTRTFGYITGDPVNNLLLKQLLEDDEPDAVLTEV